MERALFYALKPQIGLYHDTMSEYGGPDLHQYGAFIFARYISEILEQPDHLSAWRDGGTDDDPVVAANAHDRRTFRRCTVGHAAHNLGVRGRGAVVRLGGRGGELASEEDDRIAPLIDHDTENWYTVSEEDARGRRVQLSPYRGCRR